MNLYIRLVILMVKVYFKSYFAFGKKKILHPTDAEVEMLFRVGPNDIDLNRHLNNGRLVTISDLGKLELVAMIGLASPILKGKVMPVVKEHHVTYSGSAPMFSKLVMISCIEGWDEKRIYVNHKIARASDRKEIARISSSCVFLTRKGSISPTKLYRQYCGELPMMRYSRSPLLHNIGSSTMKRNSAKQFIENKNAA